MPAARQYTKQITLHENETIHYIYTIYTLYENVIWSLLPGYMIRCDRHKSALEQTDVIWNFQDRCQMTRKYGLQNFMKIGWELPDWIPKS